MSKTQAGWIWLGLGLAGAYAGWRNRRLFTVHDITTGESGAYPTLRSRVYHAQIGQAMTAGEMALKQLAGWEMLSQDSENDILEAAAPAWLGSPDDVTVYFFALGHGQIRVTIRSRSRIGFGDLGRNAAHIRQLQRAMDDRLHTESAF